MALVLDLETEALLNIYHGQFSDAPELVNLPAADLGGKAATSIDEWLIT